MRSAVLNTVSLCAIIACILSQSTYVSAQQATVQVSTFAELDAAFRKTPLQPIVVMNDIGLEKMLPNVSGSLVISGNPTTCSKSELGYCNLDARKRIRHFVVLKGGKLQVHNLYLGRGRGRTGSGGSIWLVSGATATITNVVFRFNGVEGATSGGGAIEVDDGSVLTATNVHFARNFAGFGGAIGAAARGVVNAFKCTFHRNFATTSGGGVSLIMNSVAKIRKSKFYANVAGVGAATHADASTITICNPDFYNNNSTLPGTMFTASNKSQMTTCNVPKKATSVQAGSNLVENCAACV